MPDDKKDNASQRLNESIKIKKPEVKQDTKPDPEPEDDE